ncbi:WD repeat-containing protein 86 isoform X2 [Trachypithecus francoisi]|uniref:WD repeat-containing protein 86 isoform X2 n=1 Tax=Trachypithecus francoisi TaxID=54180 RepID=UPI00141ABF44|nr:WD repeat-containing protein 86 isoform X2 [Trachypithecus francoisi]
MFLSPPPPRGRERRLGAPCALETPLPGSPGGVWVLRAVPGRRYSLPARPGLLYPGRGSGVGRPPQRPGFAGPEAGGSEELGSFTLVACLRRSRRPSSLRWPRAAAVRSRRADPGAPLPSGAQLFLVPRRASGMGGGGSALKVCADHRGGINWLSLSPDGQRLLTGSEDGTARLWSTADGQCCALLQGHESYVTFCQLEDEAAFTCSADCTIRRWDVLTGQCLQVYRGHTSIVNRILVANNQLFSSSYDRTARVWSLDKGQMSREFRGHRNCVLPLAYSGPWDLPSAPCVEEAVAGGLLVTGSTDGTAKVWQVASGCCHQTLRGHTGAVLCLVLDTPGHTAFTGSTDATIRAWDILSGEQLRVFREHQGSVICLECSRAVGTLAPGPSTRSLESCGGCSGATHSSSTASRCTARCSTPPRTTAPCASGTCAGSEVPRGPLRPRAASHASSATSFFSELEILATQGGGPPALCLLTPVWAALGVTCGDAGLPPVSLVQGVDLEEAREQGSGSFTCAGARREAAGDSVCRGELIISLQREASAAGAAPSSGAALSVSSI